MSDDPPADDRTTGPPADDATTEGPPADDATTEGPPADDATSEEPRADAEAGGVPGPDPFRRAALVAGVGLLVGVVLTFLVTARIAPRLAGRPILTFFVQLKLFVSTFNIVVLLALVSIYARLYRDLPNRFTLSLVLFSVALFLYAFTSNPIVHILLGFRGPPGLGPFTVLPDLFASLAIVVLLYQSYR